MKILVTNDDGIQSEGLHVLASELSKEHEVWIFAPEGERSGTSHAMTLRRPGLVQRLGEREFTCSGMPVDCVILTDLGVLPFIPDVVVSGINRGPNLGTDLIYSGTAGAARQAAMYRIPGIAVSLATYRPPFDYGPAARFVTENLATLKELWHPDIFINVNVPPTGPGIMPEAVFARPGRRYYRDKLASFEAPDGYRYCFLTDGRVEDDCEADTDSKAIELGKIAVTQVLIAPQTPSNFMPGPFPGKAALS